MKLLNGSSPKTEELLLVFHSIFTFLLLPVSVANKFLSEDEYIIIIMISMGRTPAESHVSDRTPGQLSQESDDRPLMTEQHSVCVFYSY